MKDSLFKRKVLRIVRSIPAGSTRTYGDVAKQAGNLKAARAVGAIMRANRDPSVPCHRVVAAHCELGGYNRGQDKKREILAKEGVEM